MSKLDGRVAIITGAGSGIGRATAILFAREGAKVVVADNVVDNGEKTVSMIKEAGGEACFVETDVSVDSDIKKMIASTLENYGKLDILFNNAGIAENPTAPTNETQVDDWDRIISVNLRGVFLGMKYAIPEMLKVGKGAIINASSLAGLVGTKGRPAYCASKGGVLLLTRAAALDHAAENIRVNCVCPGFIWTPMMETAMESADDIEEAKRQIAKMQPAGRMGTPEEVALAALFLASDDSSYITGVPLPVDGGFTAA
jgi:NAD(P)-dependent dehydrogenase (short-subunit alcohol dehydrogenase family)